MKIVKALCFLSIILTSPVKALESASNIGITRLLTDGEAFGHCMAMFGKLRTASGCKNNWLSFDCAGQFVSKEAARRHYEVAQMAIALEKEVVVFYEPTERHNGYCVVKRIDLLN